MSGACIMETKHAPAFTLEGKWDDMPRATVQAGSQSWGGHVVYEDDDWIVLKPKATYLYEVSKHWAGYKELWREQG